jgi:magnesium chelatase family protein
VAKYRSKLSGALSDRIDVSAVVDTPSAENMRSEEGESSAAVRKRVEVAVARQRERQGGVLNSRLSPDQLRTHTVFTNEAERMLAEGHRRLSLSGRGWERVVKLSLTIADLREQGEIDEESVARALAYRRAGAD